MSDIFEFKTSFFKGKLSRDFWPLFFSSNNPP
jgi:hypothetical protein